MLLVQSGGVTHRIRAWEQPAGHGPRPGQSPALRELDLCMSLSWKGFIGRDVDLGGPRRNVGIHPAYQFGNRRPTEGPVQWRTTRC